MTQIKDLILEGSLKPGERLPPELQLAKQLNVSRGEVREALSKLELHGVVKTLPQSGTFVADIGVRALSGIISSMLNLEKDNIISLLKAREFLEEKTAALAAGSRGGEDMEELEAIHKQFADTLPKRDPGTDIDMFFHLKIAEFAKNTYLSYFLSLIIPQIFDISWKFGRTDDGRFEKNIDEHFSILDAIRSGNPEKAARSMKNHLERSHAMRLVEMGYVAGDAGKTKLKGCRPPAKQENEDG
ncbi:MAG: FadR family transcriptional regulator [Spirochaetales bacterium]|jgi:GntR family transcriptional repressor for pyruvate dehydrogenase complex|nr:FadR family transcriptional regulator [Spirochaetales bacterium]